MRVAICIITRRRPEGVARLLASLEEISVPEGVEVEIVLVENDDPSDIPPPTSTLPLQRSFEAEPGIPAARNRSLEIALSNAGTTHVAFLDDDETVDPAWLLELHRGRERFGTPVVTGPALPGFPSDAPAWPERSGVYLPPRYPTGTRRPWAFTHNALVDAEVLRETGFRFEESMRHGGGSDKEFFRRLVDAGHDITWIDEAVAHEWYPTSRLTHGWVFRRSYRLGTNAPIAEGRNSPGERAALLGRAVRFGARGVLRSLASIGRPADALARAAWDLGRAAGLVAGVLGRRYDEYAERHRD
ncbi:MAG: glycosyltransferase [Planctomycetota bacterium]|nr:glycosyltransferase [Planctomycetota bacterium]MEE2895007.1 glycosyltransferase [Planctomycetota bacterium]